MALAMVEHVLAYEKDGNGLAYPFSLPAVDFYRRCPEAGVKARNAILARAKRSISSPLISRLEDILRLLKPPPIVLGRLQTGFEALCVRWTWFQRIRTALWYRNGPIPLSTTISLSDKDLETANIPPLSSGGAVECLGCKRAASSPARRAGMPPASTIWPGGQIGKRTHIP